MAAILDRLTSALSAHYRVLRELGSGGMATVYLAEDLKHQRNVAVKVLRPELAAALGSERFLREITIAAHLQHPHILPLHDSGEAEGFLYYVMPFVDGESLRERLRRDGALTVPETLHLVLEIVDALAYAHARGLVHRDIKPENIMMSGRHALVADFGIAKAVSAAGYGTGVTMVGMAVGTPAYMAPEQAAADPDTDHRADLYSVGTLAYELLAGHPPYAGNTPQSVLAAQLTTAPRPINVVRPEIPPRLAAIIMRCLENDPAQRWPSAEALQSELEAVSRIATAPARWSSRRLAVALGIAAVCAAPVGFAYKTKARQATEERWVRDTALPQIRLFADSGLREPAFALALRAMALAPWVDTALGPVWQRFAGRIDLRTHPESVTVSWAQYGDSSPQWLPLGITPLDSIRISSLARLKFEMDGYRPLELVTATWIKHEEPFTLRALGAPEDSMVDMPGRKTQVYLPGLDHLPEIQLSPFRLGRWEVTNKEFKRFVDQGGYRRRELWEHRFMLGGRSLSWEAAMARLVDKTGRPGPATWEASDYPAGQADHPVAGVSWYEAAAYAKFVRKDLPTVYHWAAAAQTPIAYAMVPRSNFSAEGPAPVGLYPGMGLYGVRDIAGNVREWCLNETGESHYILGGGWSDPEYSFTDAYAQPGFDRAPINGIRLIEYTNRDSSVALASKPVKRAFRDFSKERPVADHIFEVLKRQFKYDRLPLNAVTQAVDTTEDWIREKVEFNAAYGHERLPAYLFLPRRSKPPYQTIIYFPGSNSLHTRTAEGSLETRNFDYILKSGRAVMYPVYKSTYERGDGLSSDYADESSNYREHVVMWAKDLRRSIDYLETRPEITTEKLGYFGFSWGGALGGILPAVEPRLKVSVLLVAGLQFQRAQPEVEPLNYLPRVKIPVLMLNGQYDFFFPVKTSQIPMFRLLGTPTEHKRQVISPGGHFVPRAQQISETLAWLDRHIGAVP